MEQDIDKIINDLEMALLTDLYGHITTLVKKEDLEHLIKAYKELEEENKIIKGNYYTLCADIQMVTSELGFPEDTIIADEMISMIKDNYIPVSLVEEKIEEINKLITEAQKELGSASKEYTIYVYQKDILQELLEKRK